MHGEYVWNRLQSTMHVFAALDLPSHGRRLSLRSWIHRTDVRLGEKHNIIWHSSCYITFFFFIALSIWQIRTELLESMPMPSKGQLRSYLRQVPLSSGIHRQRLQPSVSAQFVKPIYIFSLLNAINLGLA